MRHWKSKGRTDIIIGTFTAYCLKIKFRLLVIDEEQRFGVWGIKRNLRGVGWLMSLLLTATPILVRSYMSMLGIRDLSIIETALYQTVIQFKRVMETNLVLSLRRY